MSDYNDGIIPEPCLRLDYGFGQEYASVELGDGTGYVRVTDELRGEYYKMQRWYDDELKEAWDDNAKLRELVRDFDKCLTEAVRLAYIQGHMTIYDDTLLDSLHPRMRELRIEVD